MTKARQEPARPSGGADWRRSLVEASPYLGLGMQLAFSMVFFVGAGYMLDRWLATTPWLTVVGGAVGLVAVLAHLIRMSSSLGHSPEKNNVPDADH